MQPKSADDRHTRANSRLGELRAHLPAIAELACGLEPDWDAVYEGADHQWCYDTAVAVCELLAELRLDAVIVQGGFRGNWHWWVVLPGDVILDATLRQYTGDGLERVVDAGSVPWADDDHSVALIAPGHPLHADYTASAQSG